MLRGNTDSERRERRFALEFLLNMKREKNNKNINIQFKY